MSSATRMDGTPVAFQNTKTGLNLQVEPKYQGQTVTVIKITIARPAGQISEIYPPSSSGSLAYLQPAKVSGSIAPLFMHTAQAALDDKATTYWSTGRNDSVAATIVGKKFDSQDNYKAAIWEKTGWLEVDLLQSRTVSRAHIQEAAKAGYPR